MLRSGAETRYDRCRQARYNPKRRLCGVPPNPRSSQMRAHGTVTLMPAIAAWLLIPAMAALIVGCGHDPNATELPTVASTQVASPATDRDVDGAVAEAETLTGAIAFNGDPAIPSGAVLTVELIDVTLIDAPSVLMAAQTVANPGRFPIEFSVPYNPDDIDPRSRYGLLISISLNDRLIYVNDTAFDVITGGNPNRDVEAWVIAVGSQ